jgi:hypothetical protein
MNVLSRLCEICQGLSKDRHCGPAGKNILINAHGAKYAASAIMFGAGHFDSSKGHQRGEKEILSQHKYFFLTRIC